MRRKFHVLVTSPFERDVKKLTKRNSKLIDSLDETIAILEEDPYNQSRRYRIKKLVGVKNGEGEWRIRLGAYRLRYDIIGNDVVLSSFRDRKDAY